MVSVGCASESLTMSSCPVAEPAAAGSKTTLKVAVWFVVNVRGSVSPEIEKPLPLMVAAVTIRGRAPVEVTVIVWVAGVFRLTSPKAMLVESTLIAESAAFNCKEKVLEMVPALEDSVAVWAVLTDATVAAKLVLAEPAGTVMEAGTVTAELLLESATVNPPLGAGALRAMVQVSLPDPVMDELAQERAVSTGTPVPLKAIDVEEPVDELLTSVNRPLAAPARVGSNCTVNDADWLAPIVSGNVAPEIVKPDPEIDAELITTEAVPVEFRVTSCEVAVLTATLPKLRLDAPRLNVGTPVPSCTSKVAGVPPAFAESIAVCELETDETVAMKLALAEPAATVTVDGTVTAALLLDRLTANPPAPATASSVTEQVSVPAPRKEEVVHENAEIVGCPAPVNGTVVVEPLPALLVSVS